MDQKLHVLYTKSCPGLSIDRVQREYEFSMQTRHYHDEYEIYYLLSGERYYFIEKNTYLIQSPSLVFIPKRKIHKTAAGSAYHDRILLSLSETPFSTYFSSLGTLSLSDVFTRLAGVVTLTQEEHQTMLTLFDNIITELTDQQENYEFLVWTKIAEILLSALRKKTVLAAHPTVPTITTLKHKKVDEVATYIINHCTTNYSLDYLAQHFYVSKSYLCRIFKDVTGFTIIEYQNIQRIHLAYPMLLDGNTKISEIAAELGFESVTYFEKVFRMHTGISPLRYRKYGPSLTTI